MKTAPKCEGDYSRKPTIQMCVGIFWGGSMDPNSKIMNLYLEKQKLQFVPFWFLEFVNSENWKLVAVALSILGALPKPQKKLLMHKSHLEVTHRNGKDL